MGQPVRYRFHDVRYRWIVMDDLTMQIAEKQKELSKLRAEKIKRNYERMFKRDMFIAKVRHALKEMDECQER